MIFSATGTAVLLEHEQREVNEIVGNVSIYQGVYNINHLIYNRVSSPFPNLQKMLNILFYARF